jgi:hypothetical protein
MTRAEQTLDYLRQRIEVERDLINAPSGIKSVRFTIRYDERGECIESVDMNVETRTWRRKKMRS